MHIVGFLRNIRIKGIQYFLFRKENGINNNGFLIAWNSIDDFPRLFWLKTRLIKNWPKSKPIGFISSVNTQLMQIASVYSNVLLGDMSRALVQDTYDFQWMADF